MASIPDIPDDAQLENYATHIDYIRSKRTNKPPRKPQKRTSRPIDPILRPVTLSASDLNQVSRLPASFRVIVEAANEWPYPNPDSNGLADPYPNFDDPNHSYLPDTTIDPFSESEPWGKMESESPRAYQMFTHYKAQGLARQTKETARQFDVSVGQVSSTASKYNWHARIRAWDDYRERVYTNELLMGVREMAERHTEIAKKGIEAIGVVFEGIVNQLADEDDRELLLAELAELPPRVLISLAQKSGQVIPNLMNAERLSRGLPTEITANLHQVEHTVSLQSTDDLFSIITGLAGSIAASRIGDESVESDIIEAEVIEADG